MTSVCVDFDNEGWLPISKPGDPMPEFIPKPKAIMVTPIYDDHDLGAQIPSAYARSSSRPISGYYSDSDSG
ncbi:hypothetical protein BJ165DRAFT_206167 [Panaeolus papilionaceus]|nr:hypothetical protein BJ165DRAFT_206167 [Panaeolus papilionaceus]